MAATALLLLLASGSAFGQAAFEAASIKPSTAESGSSSGITTRIGSISGHNVTLKRCIRGSYDVEESQIVGGPKWVDEDRYDIEAKAAGPAGDQVLMTMLQTLLSQRYKLVFHRETRELPGYALVVGKGGLQAKPAQPNAESRTNSSRSAIDAEACTMHQLAQKLSEVIHSPVADVTGVDGTFDFNLKWTPEDPRGLTEGPSVLMALQDQLGLKLEPRKVPTEVLVIDHAEKPSEN